MPSFPLCFRHYSQSEHKMESSTLGGWLGRVVIIVSCLLGLIWARPLAVGVGRARLCKCSCLCRPFGYRTSLRARLVHALKRRHLCFQYLNGDCGQRHKSWRKPMDNRQSGSSKPYLIYDAPNASTSVLLETDGCEYSYERLVMTVLG